MCLLKGLPGMVHITESFKITTIRLYFWYCLITGLFWISLLTHFITSILVQFSSSAYITLPVVFLLISSSTKGLATANGMAASASSTQAKLADSLSLEDWGNLFLCIIVQLLSNDAVANTYSLNSSCHLAYVIKRTLFKNDLMFNSNYFTSHSFEIIWLRLLKYVGVFTITTLFGVKFTVASPALLKIVLKYPTQSYK